MKIFLLFIAVSLVSLVALVLWESGKIPFILALAVLLLLAVPVYLTAKKYY